MDWKMILAQIGAKMLLSLADSAIEHLPEDVEKLRKKFEERKKEDAR